MARRGRQRWSTRPLVENCLALDIAHLVRAGAFRAKPKSPYSVVWQNPEEPEIFRASFCVDLVAPGKMLLHLYYDVPRTQDAQSETIEIAKTPLRFGPRLWFLCPGTHNDAPCRRRVRILYFLPNTYRVGCRTCLNLIHRSARQHDARIDALLRLPIEQFREVLHNDAMRLGSLAFRVGRALQRQLEREQRITSRRHSGA
jgi:hypothetical protein